jgi:hypothetical protein
VASRAYQRVARRADRPGAGARPKRPPSISLLNNTASPIRERGSGPIACHTVGTPRRLRRSTSGACNVGCGRPRQSPPATSSKSPPAGAVRENKRAAEVKGAGLRYDQPLTNRYGRAAKTVWPAASPQTADRLRLLPAVHAGILAADLDDGLLGSGAYPGLANFFRLYRRQCAAELRTVELPGTGNRNRLISGWRDRA